MPKRQIIVQITLYGVVFAALAKWLPLAVFVPVASFIAVAQLVVSDRRKRRRFHEIVTKVRSLPIESGPTLELDARRGTDALVFESFKDVASELEKKSYQLVEKNIQALSLNEITLTTISSVDETKIVGAVKIFLSKGLGFREMFIGLFDADRQAFRIYAFREGAKDPIQREQTVLLRDTRGQLRKAVFGRKSMLIKDPDMHPIGDMNGEAMFPGSTMESYLIVPMVRSTSSPRCRVSERCLLREGEGMGAETPPPEEGICPVCRQPPVLGVIGVTDGFKAATLSKVDLVSVESLALQINTLLENNRLYTELKQEQEFRDDVINSMMSGLITVEPGGEILLANQAAEGLTGYGAAELRGMRVDRLFVDNPAGGGDGPVLRAFRGGRKTFQEEAWLVKKDGTKLPVVLNTSFLRDENKEIHGALAVFNDITRIKGMEEEIRHLDKLAALGRFSSSIAHEIRNPLAGIVAGLQYLRRAGSIPDDQDENISFILNEVNRIDRLITDMLSVVQRGDLVFESTQIESVIRNSVTSLADVAEKKSVKVVLEFPKESRPVVIDPDRIMQVMINLIKNAIEASAEGSEVRIGVSFSDSVSDVLFDEGRCFVIIKVEDDGIGFSEQEKSRIFEPFFTRKPAGTGLGLYVTHTLVERHGGYIFVESTPDEGSVFTVFLPVEKVQYGEPSKIRHPVGG